MAPEQMLVFAGASDLWGRRSVATLLKAKTEIATQSPPRKPLTALLPDSSAADAPLPIRSLEPLQGKRDGALPTIILALADFVECDRGCWAWQRRR
jgi:hypothetical protein